MSARAWKWRLRQELAQLAEALFPATCGLCGAAAVDGFACARHALRESSARARCGRCAALLPASLPDGARCSSCRLDPPSWSRLIPIADYGLDPALREWVLALKHGGRSDLAESLGELLGRRLALAGTRGEIELRGALLSSVPLHPTRRFLRGYDQAALLARAAALELGLAYQGTLLRTRATSPQGAPGSRSRSANVRAAFRARRLALRSLRGKTVILVDDVVTSGSTAAECCRCLRRAGAASVVVACLARASPRSPG